MQQEHIYQTRQLHLQNMLPMKVNWQGTLRTQKRMNKIGAQNELTDTHNGLFLEIVPFKISLLKEFASHHAGHAFLDLPGLGDGRHVACSHEHAPKQRERERE